MLDADKLGKKIQKARKNKKLTGEQLAENLEISLGFLREMERGGKKPSLDTFVDIANALDVRADDLLCDSIDASRDLMLEGIAKKLEGLPKEQVELIEKIIDKVFDT